MIRKEGVIDVRFRERIPGAIYFGTSLGPYLTPFQTTSHIYFSQSNSKFCCGSSLPYEGKIRGSFSA
jgi:hypothetical protein